MIPSAKRPRRLTFRRLVVEELHYCCPWAFLRRNWRRTQVIADRLGLATSTIRYAKADFKSGKLQCEGCSKCLKDKLR